MNEYKIKISLQSPLGTKLMADTIWGHICYGILFNEGEDVLTKFLKSYNDDQPSLILSTPFPEGKIPLPKTTISKEYKKDINEIKILDYRKLKLKKKIKYLNLNNLTENDRIDIENLIEKEVEEAKFSNEKWQLSYFEESRFHNIIDRITGTTNKDGIFQTEQYWYLRSKDNNNIKTYSFPILDIYVLSTFDKDYTLKLFKNGIEYGYGADSSTGKGIIKVESIEDFNFPKTGKTAIALSPFILNSSEYEQMDKNFELYADVWTKYPKVHNSLKGMTNPFKKPIVFYKEGATIRFNDESKSKPLYIGNCAKNIHHIPDIMQYAIAPLFWINLN